MACFRAFRYIPGKGRACNIKFILTAITALYCYGCLVHTTPMRYSPSTQVDAGQLSGQPPLGHPRYPAPLHCPDAHLSSSVRLCEDRDLLRWCARHEAHVGPGRLGHKQRKRDVSGQVRQCATGAAKDKRGTTAIMGLARIAVKQGKTRSGWLPAGRNDQCQEGRDTLWARPAATGTLVSNAC